MCCLLIGSILVEISKVFFQEGLFLWGSVLQPLAVSSWSVLRSPGDHVLAWVFLLWGALLDVFRPNARVVLEVPYLFSLTRWPFLCCLFFSICRLSFAYTCFVQLCHGFCWKDKHGNSYSLTPQNESFYHDLFLKYCIPTNICASCYTNPFFIREAPVTQLPSVPLIYQVSLKRKAFLHRILSSFRLQRKCCLLCVV